MPPQPQIQLITPNTADQTPQHPTISVFLSGATKTNWRETFLTILASKLPSTTQPHPPYPSITVYDPTQPLWAADWREDLADGRFGTQVAWELDRLDAAAVVAVFFERASESPVSLLEFGLCAHSGRAVVGCGRGYWKRGNVEAVCLRYGVPMADDLDGLVALVLDRLESLRA